MICLTSDIHHSSLGTGNQIACEISEVEVARRFIDLLKEFDCKATYFISGKAFEQQWDEVKLLCDEPLISIQGHNYRCFTPEIWHRISKKVWGSYNGPKWYQRQDLEKTISIIQKKTGRKITCWRNHMYMHGPYTDELLLSAGIRYCSDFVKKDGDLIKTPSGLIHVPINVIPDHEHIYHAERTKEFVQWWKKRYNWSDDFGSDSYEIGKWKELVIEQIRRNRENKRVSVLMIHPITMYLCDRFRSFITILEEIQNDQSLHMDEL